MSGESAKGWGVTEPDPRWFGLAEVAQNDAGAVSESPAEPAPAYVPKVPEMANLAHSEKLATPVTAEEYLRRHGRDLVTFARDASLNYTPRADAKTFSFNADTFTVNLPTSWFESGEYSESELTFSNYHELSHFADMRENPDAYLENFDRMEQKANKLAAEYGKNHPEADTKQMADYYYEQLHTLYNCLDDIYVNNMVQQRAPVYSVTDNGRQAVTSLYSKLGYDDPDLTGQPLHEQLAYSLLQDEMMGDTIGQSIVSPEVEAALSKKTAGRDMRAFVKERLRPQGNRPVDPAKRYYLIENRIEPVYLELLAKEAEKQEQNEPNPPQSGGKGSADESSGDRGGSTAPGSNDGSGGNGGSGSKRREMPSGIDDDTLKDILKSFKEAGDEANMSPDEQAAHRAAKTQEKFDREHDITPEQRKAYEKIATKIAKPRLEMRKFWNSLIGKSLEFEQKVIHEQRRGRLNVNDFITHYPDFVNAQKTGDFGDLHFYDQKQLEQILVEKPEAIEVTLLVDRSGSMAIGERQEMAREAAALLMLSVKDFNNELIRQKDKTHSRLTANSQVIVFGSEYTEVKSFEKRQEYYQNEAQIIKTVAAIDSNGGGTNDAAPLAKITAGISSEQRRKIKDGKLLKIVFEITDGSPDNSVATQTAVKNLMDTGAMVFAFQIGNMTEEKQKEFSEIWSPEGYKSAGMYLGDDIKKLPSQLMDTLAEALKGIRI